MTNLKQEKHAESFKPSLQENTLNEANNWTENIKPVKSGGNSFDFSRRR